MKITEEQYYEAHYENDEITSNGNCPLSHLTSEELRTYKGNRVVIENYEYERESHYVQPHYENAPCGSIYDY